MNIMDIEIGKPYNCTFTVHRIPLDEYGRPGGMLSMADLPIASIGDYTSTGDLVARDVDEELVEVICRKSNKKFVVAFEDLSDIKETVDEAE